MPRLYYPDAFLQRFCDDEREARAYNDVDTYGTFSVDYRDKLARIRTYVLSCMENQADNEDLFTTKLETYRREFERVLVLAKTETPDIDGLVPPVFSIEIGRS